MTLIERTDTLDLHVEIETPQPRRYQLGASTVEIVYDLHGELGESAWRLYEQQFRELDGIALQRHLMTKPEFVSVARLSGVEKWLVFDRQDTLIGLATYSNNLGAMPLISPAYFARRWPDAYARQAIWYCGFVCVDSPDRAVFPALIRAMYDQAADVKGVIALDYCAERGRLALMVDRLLAAHGGPGYHGYEADTQHYWVYETAPSARAAA